MMYSSGRASKSEAVARSLRMGAGPNADQGEVWKKINQLLRKLRVSSDSSEMHAAYVQRDEDLQEIRAALELPEDTVGVAVYDGDRLLGLDLFDRAPTLARHWKSLVDSYAIEWLAVSEAGQAREAGSENDPPVEELLSTLSEGQWQRFDAPGEGSDMRWQDDRLTASALVWGDDNIVHLQAFPRQHETTAH